MSMILRANHRQIWTRSRSQTLIRPDQLFHSQSQESQPLQKRCKYDDDENTECLGFSADEISSRSPPLQPLIHKQKQTKLVEATKGRPNTKKTSEGKIKEKRMPKIDRKPLTRNPPPARLQDQRKQKESIQNPTEKRPKINKGLTAEECPPKPSKKKLYPNCTTRGVMHPALGTPVLRKLPVVQNVHETDSVAVDVQEKPVTPVRITNFQSKNRPTSLQPFFGKGQLSQFQRNLLSINSKVPVSHSEETDLISFDLPQLPAPQIDATIVNKVDMKSLGQPHNLCTKALDPSNEMRLTSEGEPMNAPSDAKSMPASIPIVKTKYPIKSLPRVKVTLSPNQDPGSQTRKVIKMEMAQHQKVRSDTKPVVKEKGCESNIKLVQPKEEAPMSPPRVRPRALVGYKITMPAIKPAIEVVKPPNTQQAIQKSVVTTDSYRTVTIIHKKVTSTPKMTNPVTTAPKTEKMEQTRSMPTLIPMVEPRKTTPLVPSQPLVKERIETVTDDEEFDEPTHVEPPPLEWKHNQNLLGQLKQVALSPNQEDMHEKLMIMADMCQQVEKQRTPPRCQVVVEQPVVPKTFIFTQTSDTKAPSMVILTPALFAEIVAKSKQNVKRAAVISTPSVATSNNDNLTSVQYHMNATQKSAGVDRAITNTAKSPVVADDRKQVTFQNQVLPGTTVHREHVNSSMSTFNNNTVTVHQHQVIPPVVTSSSPKIEKLALVSSPVAECSQVFTAPAFIAPNKGTDVFQQRWTPRAPPIAQYQAITPTPTVTKPHEEKNEAIWYKPAPSVFTNKPTKAAGQHPVVSTMASDSEQYFSGQYEPLLKAQTPSAITYNNKSKASVQQKVVSSTAPPTKPTDEKCVAVRYQPAHSVASHKMNEVPIQYQVKPAKPATYNNQPYNNQTTATFQYQTVSPTLPVSKPDEDKYVAVRYQSAHCVAANNKDRVTTIQHQKVSSASCGGTSSNVKLATGMRHTTTPSCFVASHQISAPTHSDVAQIAPAWNPQDWAPKCNQNRTSEPPKGTSKYYDIKKIGNSCVISKKTSCPSNEQVSMSQPTCHNDVALNTNVLAKPPQAAVEQVFVRPDQMFERNGKFYAIIKKSENGNIQLLPPHSVEVCVSPSVPDTAARFNSTVNSVRNDRNLKKNLKNIVKSDFADDLKELQDLMKKRHDAEKSKQLDTEPQPKPKPKSKHKSPGCRKHYYFETIDLTVPQNPVVSIDLTMPPAMGTRRATKQRNLQHLESKLAALGVTMEVCDGPPNETPAPNVVKMGHKSYHTPDFVKQRLSFQYDNSLTGIQLLQTPEVPVLKDPLWGQHSHRESLDDEMVDLLKQSPAVMVQYLPVDFTEDDLTLNGLSKIPIGELLDSSQV